jgi:hypothetical protein
MLPVDKLVLEESIRLQKRRGLPGLQSTTRIH